MALNKKTKHLIWVTPHVTGHPGSQMGIKWSKIIHLSKTSPPGRLAQRSNFSPYIWYCYSFRKKYNSSPFWSNLGVKKGKKLPILLIITHKSRKFARVDNFSWEIRCCNIFKRILQFFDVCLLLSWISRTLACSNARVVLISDGRNNLSD